LKRRKLIRTLSVFAAAAMITLSGCYYGYGGYGSWSQNTPKTTAAVDTIPALEMSELADSTGMFVFPGVTWGMTQEEVESALGISIGTLTEFADGGGYADLNVNYNVDGKISVGMMPVFDEDGGLSSLSIYFEDLYTAEELDQLYADTVADATAAFGDPAKVTPEDRDVNNTTYHTETTFWFFDVSETQQTSLQIGTTDVGKGTNAVIIGVNSYDPATLEDETGEDATDMETEVSGSVETAEADTSAFPAEETSAEESQAQ
jgi:hypothetical protein